MPTLTTAVNAAVLAYSGPGSLAFNAGTNQLTFTSDGTGKMANLAISLAASNDSLLEASENYSVAISSPGSTTGQTITTSSCGQFGDHEHH